MKESTLFIKVFKEWRQINLGDLFEIGSITPLRAGLF